MPQVVTLKNVKIANHLSQETTAYTASIYLNGKRIGDVRNDGGGGCDMIHINAADRTAFAAVVESEWTGDSLYEKAKDEELMMRLLEKFETDRQTKRWTKTQVVWRVEGDAEGKFRTLKHKGNIPGAKEWVRNKYGNKIIEMYP